MNGSFYSFHLPLWIGSILLHFDISFFSSMLVSHQPHQQLHQHLHQHLHQYLHQHPNQKPNTKAAEQNAVVLELYHCKTWRPPFPRQCLFLEHYTAPRHRTCLPPNARNANDATIRTRSRTTRPSCPSNSSPSLRLSGRRTANTRTNLIRLSMTIPHHSTKSANTLTTRSRSRIPKTISRMPSTSSFATARLTTCNEVSLQKHYTTPHSCYFNVVK